MEIKSIGLKTNLFMSSLLGQIYDRGDYIVIKTPLNPKFHWGNFVVFPSSPRHDDYQKWIQIFKSEFKNIQSIEHMLFVWDDPFGATGEIQEFICNGFKESRGVYLSAEEVISPQYPNNKINIRAIESDSDWGKLLDSHPEEYLRNQLIEQRKWINKGAGYFFGAFYKDELVADLGIFFENDVGRFQNVSTKEAFRRQGICGTLVHHAANYAFKQHKAKSLIMEADEDYIAARIYESVGFKAIEKSMAISYSK
jgi:ribosomal protein S18 acetylase RimI-like enzyme